MCGIGIFQYISCYCLSSVVVIWIRKRNDFNTSHVTVYLISIRCHSILNEFQYISCYCLSMQLPCVSLTIKYFNTSHVTVYQDERLDDGSTDIFQYISCYCLSSRRAICIINCGISIHLMLLFISIIDLDFDHESYFNTSHVTVYRRLHKDL